MSEPNTENEPTMEEILASIRKIISEDEPEEGASGDSETEAAAPEAEEGVSEDSEAEAAAPEAEEADDDSDEPLELTQMVGEDGNVVDLKAHQEETAAAEAEDESEAAPEPEAEENDEAEPAVEEDSEIELEANSEGPAVEEDSEIELEADSEGPAEDLEQEEEEAEDVEEEDEDDIPLPSPSEDVEEGLVSAMTATLATDTISQLSDVLNTESAQVGGISAADKTLEALVRETISPHLKAWMDANLPDLVERIVRDEIKKMVKRAEYR